MRRYICENCNTIVKIRDGWFLPKTVELVLGTLWCAQCTPFLKRDFGTDCHTMYLPSTGRMKLMKEEEISDVA